MPNEQNVITSHNTLNYSGMLFNKGDTKHPFTSMIRKSRNVANCSFPCGVTYDTDEVLAQPAISESASLTAPEPERIERAQIDNITQIFHRAGQISYQKMSDMNSLAGLNIAGQSPNPPTEEDFQVAGIMEKLSGVMEYTAINGVYNKAGDDSEANKTRGLLAAITSNVLDAQGKPLGFWLVSDILKTMYENNADTSSIVAWLSATAMLQFQADAKENGFTIVPDSREVNGISVSTVVTPLGTLPLMLSNKFPAGTVGIANMSDLWHVFQPVPGKGSFFKETLSKTGASEKFQIYGQWGLDHGPEWHHAKIINLATTFKSPENGFKVYVEKPVSTVEVAATLQGAVLDKTSVAATDNLTVAVETLSYNAEPKTAATLTYLWQIRAASGTTWTDLTSAYTGYNTSELSVKAADTKKHYRCKVSATGSAKGTVYSDECTMA